LNGTPDECENLVDCNLNGTPDVCETGPDCNLNGVPDDCELVGNDCNLNGVPDECDTDCNANSIPDDCETLVDCNLNGTPDECELVGNDCNLNGVPDECDPDCNINGTPDDCENLPDCNENGVPDFCDIAGGTSQDTDGNGIPDECTPGTSFCFGDGSGTPCPCGNIGGAGEGCANGTGNGGTLDAGGTDSVAADDMTLHAHKLPGNAMVLLFSGLNQLNGGAGVVFGDGLRCTGGDIRRHGIRVASASGEASWSAGLVAAHGWGSGTQRNFQGWYRDANSSPCGQNFNLTSGLAVTFTP
jgi:hypothetical protein